MVNFSYFEFENITEKLSEHQYYYVVENIKLSKLLKIKSKLPKSDVFLAYIKN